MEVFMQFHLNGYHSGDPSISDPADRCSPQGAEGPLPKEVDVLIVGAGPAGLNLAAQLAAFPEIKTCIIEKNSGRLLHGKADGIACRTVEMFNAFGFADRVVKEACGINEATFWKPDPSNPETVVRSSRVQDVEDGLSEFPHVIINQARVEDFLLDVMAGGPAKIKPYYLRRVLSVKHDPAARFGEHSVTVTVEHLDINRDLHGKAEVVKARYVVGCDGARSAVREPIGGKLHGDAANVAWGVMDVLAVTDFPDVRFKSVIQSAKDGTILLIPREGGYMFRLYTELATLQADERVADRNIKVKDIIAKAQQIFKPYKLDVKEVAWWSVYEIGQRVTDSFDDVPKDQRASRFPVVFTAGDACHTHSPKAGQGLNVTMQDTFNLGWKLAQVIRGRCAPHLLHTYSAERQPIAQEFIDMDREWAATIGSGKGADSDKTRDKFKSNLRYTAGVATHYTPSLLTGKTDHQNLAQGFVIGMRFHSAPVVRLCDALPMHLGHVHKADGRFRIYAFAGSGDPTAADSKIRALCNFLAQDQKSPVKKYTRKGEDIDSLIDVYGVFQQSHKDIAIEKMPELLLPRKGCYGLIDYEKMYCADLKSGQDIFTMRGIDRKSGCMVVVRPDQYIAQVLPLDAHAELAAYFDGFMQQ